VSKNTPKDIDTEYAAMQAWARLVNAGKAPTYEPEGIPVRDGNNHANKP